MDQLLVSQNTNALRYSLMVASESVVMPVVLGMKTAKRGGPGLCLKRTV